MNPALNRPPSLDPWREGQALFTRRQFFGRSALGLGTAALVSLLARDGWAAGGGPLSPREREVLHLVSHGRSNEEIASGLVLSVRTVERHVANVYCKLGLSGRTARAAATAWAHEHGIA